MWPLWRLTPDRGQEEEHQVSDGGHLIRGPVTPMPGASAGVINPVAIRETDVRDLKEVRWCLCLARLVSGPSGPEGH